MGLQNGYGDIGHSEIPDLTHPPNPQPNPPTQPNLTLFFTGKSKKEVEKKMNTMILRDTTLQYVIDGYEYTWTELVRSLARDRREQARNRAKSLRSYHRRTMSSTADSSTADSSTVDAVTVTGNAVTVDENTVTGNAVTATDLTGKWEEMEMPPQRMRKIVVPTWRR